MIKKLFILICLVLLSVTAYGWHIAMVSPANPTSPSVKPSAVSCTSTISQETDDTYSSLDDSPDSANRQRIKTQGAEKTICQVDLKLYYSTSAGNVHIEIWNTAYDTQYGDDSNTVLVNSADTGGVVYNFTWSGTEPVVPNGDFDMYIDREDNAVRIRTQSDETSYQDTNYDLWTYSADVDEDAWFKVYTR
ncbi:MAG: hypothetical protein KAS32_27480 [Candidatus Peribacteraceae bacterium]|nr:hypothetical protein [Candidatus Peribacteraceae bacterium]